jgi:hypothetical protein
VVEIPTSPRKIPLLSDSSAYIPFLHAHPCLHFPGLYSTNKARSSLDGNGLPLDIKVYLLTGDATLPKMEVRRHGILELAVELGKEPRGEKTRCGGEEESAGAERND